MSLNELDQGIDKDILLQEINQIKSTLEATYDLTDLDETDGLPANENEEKEVEEVESDDEEPRKKTKNLNFGYYYKGQDQESDSEYDESSSSDGDSSYQIYQKKEPKQFGHFFQALNDKVKSVAEGIANNEENSSISINPLNNSPLALSPAQSINTQSHDNYAMSVDVSVPSTFSTLPPKKKQQLNMANLYVERIFRGFKKNSSQPTISSVSKVDTRTLTSSGKIETMEQLLQLNRNYQEILTDQLKAIRVALTKNRLAQDEVTSSFDTGIEKLGKTSLSRSCLGRFRQPYFKDADGYGPPFNEDTRAIRNLPLISPFCRGGKPWRTEEIKALREGVYTNNLERILDPVLKRLKECDKQFKERKTDSESLENKQRASILKNIAEIKAKPIDEILCESFEIDFLKVSKNFVPDRDEFECQVYWCNVLHPSINQLKFTKEEDSKLIKLAKKYKNTRWESIAKDLGTKRTPVQCLQRFQRTLNKSILKTVWSPEDDTRLMAAMKRYQRDWVLIADYVGGRTPDQCVHRWEHTLNPSIKRGKWSQEEDNLLVEAVSVHGKGNWKVIKHSVPGRTAAQCRERYVSRLDPRINNSPFTLDEDRLLVELSNQFGIGKWAAIAKYFPGRQDAHLLRRYKSLEPKKFKEYQKSVLDKNKEVLTYFMHRSDERRDYNIQDLDIDSSSTDEKGKSAKKQKPKGKKQPADEARHDTFQDEETNSFVKLDRPEVAIKPRSPYDFSHHIAQELGQGGAHSTLILDEDGMDEPKFFRAKCNIALCNVRRRLVLPATLEKEMEDCMVTLKRRKPEKASELKLILEESFNKLKEFNEQVVHFEMNITNESPFARTTHRRKATNPLRVVDVVGSKSRNTTNKTPFKTLQSSTTKTASDSASDETDSPSASGPLSAAATKSARKTLYPDDVDFSDQLKAFTWILQALHVDTVGVMRQLPQKALADSIQGKDPYAEGSPFPQCTLLPPNTASLKGFRTLLLHRKRLSEQVEKSTERVDKKSVQSTKMYEALRMRFKSMFIWPAFLSIFMPRRVEGLSKNSEPTSSKLQTPSKLPQFNLNKRMMNVRGGRGFQPSNIKTPVAQELETPPRLREDTPLNHLADTPPLSERTRSKRSDIRREEKTPKERRASKRKISPGSKGKAPAQSGANRVWTRRTDISDEKLSKLVDNYLSDRKKQDSNAVFKKKYKNPQCKATPLFQPLFDSSCKADILSTSTCADAPPLTKDVVINALSKDLAVAASTISKKSVSPTSFKDFDVVPPVISVSGDNGEDVVDIGNSNSSTIHVSSSNQVFMPQRVLMPPGEKRPMLGNTVVALEIEEGVHSTGNTSSKKAKRD